MPIYKGRWYGLMIVEIVVVIGRISILAAISVIGYGAWRERVAETEVASDISGVMAGMEDWRNFNDGYPVFAAGSEFDGSNDTSDIFASSEDVRLVYVQGDGSSYCVEAHSIARPNVFRFFNSADNNKTARLDTCAGGDGASPPSPEQTIFVFDTRAPGCTGTVQQPVSQPTSGGTMDWGDGTSESRVVGLMSHTYGMPGTYSFAYRRMGRLQRNYYGHNVRDSAGFQSIYWRLGYFKCRKHG